MNVLKRAAAVLGVTAALALGGAEAASAETDTAPAPRPDTTSILPIGGYGHCGYWHPHRHHHLINIDLGCLLHVVL
jgi:hypothetical protein